MYFSSVWLNGIMEKENVKEIINNSKKMFTNVSFKYLRLEKFVFVNAFKITIGRTGSVLKSKHNKLLDIFGCRPGKLQISK